MEGLEAPRAGYLSSGRSAEHSQSNDLAGRGIADPSPDQQGCRLTRFRFQNYNSNQKTRSAAEKHGYWAYLQTDALEVEKLGRGIAWLDTGTHESFAQATNFIQTIEQRQGLKIACLEEIAYRMGYIAGEELGRLAATMKCSSYGDYLFKILRESEG